MHVPIPNMLIHTSKPQIKQIHSAALKEKNEKKDKELHYSLQQPLLPELGELWPP